MSIVAIGLDLLLASLLAGALMMGWKLNGRLKSLRASQADFAQAVVELDAAAARAEAGLSNLRAAAEEAHDSLLARIDTARSLAAKLEKAEMSADAAARRAEAAAAEVKAAVPAPRMDRASEAPERLGLSHPGLRDLIAEATGTATEPEKAAPRREALSREHPARPAPRRRNIADEALFAEAETDVRPSLQGLMRLSLNGRK